MEALPKNRTELDTCTSLFLREIGEPKQDYLRMLVEEAFVLTEEVTVCSTCNWSANAILLTLSQLNSPKLAGFGRGVQLIRPESAFIPVNPRQRSS